LHVQDLTLSHAASTGDIQMICVVGSLQDTHVFRTIQQHIDAQGRKYQGFDFVLYIIQIL